MTLEEIRILARDEEDAEGDTARNCMGGAEKRELAALLVRAVEALTAMVRPTTLAGYDINYYSAAALLRELGVEA